MDLGELQYPIAIYGNRSSITDLLWREKGKILLLANDLKISGASLVFAYAASILHKYFSVVVGTTEDGEVRELLEQRDIPIVVDANISVSTMAKSGWMKGFSLVFCNTLNYFHFLSERFDDVPAIWWLHEPDFFYGNVTADRLKKSHWKSCLFARWGR